MTQDSLRGASTERPLSCRIERVEDGKEFENKPLAGLSALRGKLPPGPEQEKDAEPQRAKSDGRFAAKVVCQREKKKRGGKTVTRVRGLLGDPAASAKELSKALGCGGSVDEGDVLLQGDQVRRVAKLLRERGAPNVIEGN